MSVTAAQQKNTPRGVFLHIQGSQTFFGSRNESFLFSQFKSFAELF